MNQLGREGTIAGNHRPVNATFKLAPITVRTGRRPGRIVAFVLLVSVALSTPIGFLAVAAHAEQSVVYTVAGGGPRDLPALSAGLNVPVAIARNQTTGDLYVASRNGNVVLRVSGATGLVSVVAGTGFGGSFNGDGIPALQAHVLSPTAVAVDSTTGDVLIASSGRLLRLVVATGVIVTAAGGGNAAVVDGLLATEVSLLPDGVAVDPVTGDILIAEEWRGRVFRVAAGTGIINTVAGGGFTDGDGIPATAAVLFPYVVAVDPGSGDLILSERGRHRVRRVSATTGLISTVAGTGFEGFNGDGIPASSAQLWNPEGVAVDPATGDILIADFFNRRIRRVEASSGLIVTVAGTGTQFGSFDDEIPATDASILPQGVAVDATAGDVFIAEGSSLGRIRRVAASSGLITTVAGNTTLSFGGDGHLATNAQLNMPFSVAVDSTTGDVVIGDFGNAAVRRVSAATGLIETIGGSGVEIAPGCSYDDGVPATTACFAGIFGVAVDATSGDVLVIDTASSLLRRISSATGLISTVAGVLHQQGYSGEEIPAAGSLLDRPVSLAVDPASGDILIGEIPFSSGGARVRRIVASSGLIRTEVGGGTITDPPDGTPALDAAIGAPWGLAIHPQTGELHFGETFVIRRVSGGQVFRVAGGGTLTEDGAPALSANLAGTNAIAFSPATADMLLSMEYVVRRLRAATRLVETVAGTGVPGFSGDGGDPLAAEFHAVRGAAVDPATDDVLVADTVNHRIRRIHVVTAQVDTAITSGPPGLTSSMSASFGFASTAPGSTFECRLDSGSFGACASPQTYTGLADGTHTFHVRATDPGGNTDPTPASYTWVVDATPPDTIITSGPPETTASNSVTITFTSTEASSFECSLDGNGFDPCMSPREYTSIAGGAHTFEVRAIDGVGNVDPTPASLTWTVDTAPPDTTITFKPLAVTANTTATFHFTSTKGGSSFACSLDGGAFTACTSPQVYGGLANGTHTFQVRATDGVGNADPSPASYSWIIDTTRVEDIAASVLARFVIDTPSVDAGSGPATVRATTLVQDDLSGIDRVSWTLRSPSGVLVGGPLCSRVGGTSLEATYECTATLPQFSEAGTWQVSRVDTRDVVGNTRTYLTAELTALGFDTSFTNTGQQDTLAPVLAGLVIDTPSVDASSGPATVRATTLVRDDLSGIDRVSWTLRSPSGVLVGGPLCSRVGGTSLEATYECTATLPQFSETGTWQVFRVDTRDVVGNSRTYLAAELTALGFDAGFVNTPEPDTLIVDRPPTVTNNTTARFTFTSTDLESAFECSLDGSMFSSCASPQSYHSLAEGTHTFEVRATDSDGNTDSTPASYTWIIQLPTLAALPITIDGSGPGTLTSRWLIGQSEGFFTLGANASPANRLLSDDTVVAVDDILHISGVVQICDSSLCDGSNPSYSRVFDGDGVVNLAGKSVTTDEQSILGLNVTHSFTIVDGPGVARAFLTLQNPTSDDISIVVRSGFNLSSQDIVAASSSGDTTFDTADRWLIVRRGTASNPPTTVDTMVHFGPGAPAVTPSEVGKGADIYQASFPATVPAGETVHLMWFLGMHLDQTGAMADFGIFDDVTSASVLVADLTAAQRSRIVNWDFRDLDGDGIPDYMDNCPETPNPDQDESACAVEPPDTTITSAPPDTSTSASASFTFTSTAAGSTFECRLDDGGFVPCSSPQTYTGLADGTHAFQVRATDPSGNTDPTPASHAWSIDATPPDTIITSGPSELTTSTTATVTFMSTEAGSFECSLDGSAFAACTTPRDYSGLADGIHTFRVRAIDAVGNPDPAPASLTWTVDTTAPDTSITSGPPATTTSSTASLGFTSTESGAFECSLDGSPFTGCTSPAEYSGLALGSHAFQVRAMDLAGNVDPTPASHSWTIQAADDAPTISGFSPASGGVATSVTISGVNLAGTSAVMFNGVQATYKVQGRTKITATVPLGATTGPIAVTAPGGMATSVTSFTVIPAPAITGFSPASGRAGSSVTITGTNLGGATAVRFNGSTAKFTIVSTTALTATVPNGAKTGPISVTTPGGTATSAAIFTVTK